MAKPETQSTILAHRQSIIQRDNIRGFDNFTNLL